MAKKRDPRIPSDLLGKAYPLGQDRAAKVKRLKKYALEALAVPCGVVILELYLDFYRSWDLDTYKVNVGKLVLSFAVAYAAYFVLNWLYSEHKVRQYEAWKAQTFRNESESR